MLHLIGSEHFISRAELFVPLNSIVLREGKTACSSPDDFRP